MVNKWQYEIYLKVFEIFSFLFVVCVSDVIEAFFRNAKLFSRFIATYKIMSNENQ